MADTDLVAENQRLREALARAEAEVERLRIRWWRHTDACSMLCTDACNSQHTYEPGCACASTTNREAP